VTQGEHLEEQVSTCAQRPLEYRGPRHAGTHRVKQLRISDHDPHDLVYGQLIAGTVLKLCRA
jgi:hypothetical protein